MICVMDMDCECVFLFLCVFLRPDGKVIKTGCFLCVWMGRSEAVFRFVVLYLILIYGFDGYQTHFYTIHLLIS